MKIKRIVCMTVVSLIVVIGLTMYLMNMSVKDNNQNSSNNLNKNSKNILKAQTNIEYFKELKPIKNVKVKSINCRLMATTEDFYIAEVPISSESMDKFAPFTLSGNKYDDWEALLSSNEKVNAKSFISIRGEKLFDYGTIQLWNKEKEDRTAKECFEDGDIIVQVAKFTMGIGSSDYMNKPEGFTENHEMLDDLFQKFGTPTYYKYLTNISSSNHFLQLIFEYGDFSIYAEVYPNKTKDGLEFFNLQDVVYCGGKTIELVEEFERSKTGNTRYTKTKDIDKMIEEYLTKVEY